MRKYNKVMKLVWVVIWLLADVFLNSVGFNVETTKDNARYLRSPNANTYFGYDMSLSQTDYSWSAIVGAPKARSNSMKPGKITGDILQCPVVDLSSPSFGPSCSSIAPPSMKSGSLGLNIDSSDNGNLLTCTANQQLNCTSILYNPGFCYKSTSTRSEWRSVAILENNVCPSYTLDMIFLLDGSGSVGYENFDLVKNWIKELTRSFNISDDSTRIGVVQYSHYSSDSNEQSLIRTEIALGSITDHATFNEAIDNITLQGFTTYTAHALTKTISDFQQSDRFSDPLNSKILILLTDGQSNDREELEAAASSVRALGIKTFAVGVGLAMEDELKIVATGTDSNKRVYYVSDFNGLNEITNHLQVAILSYALEGTRNSSTVTFDFEFGQKGFSIKYSAKRRIPEYLVPDKGYQSNVEENLKKIQLKKKKKIF